MPAEPEVSILMVARNAGRTIDAALHSARRQTVTAIEIVVVDDGSVDDTPALARAHAAIDPRVRVLPGPRRGLSAVRNASLHAAHARLALILDSDDLLHPRHVEWLLRARRRSGAEICASNMIAFSIDDGGTALQAHLFAQGGPWGAPHDIATAHFVASNMIGDGASPGYLKPLLDMDFLRARGLGYDERLRIGEDFDLVLRCLVAGARYRFVPEPTYFYRRHAGSTSHRLDRADLTGLLLALDQVEAGADDALARALAARRTNLTGTLRHLDAVAALKHHAWLRAWAILRGDPVARRLMRGSVREGLARRLGLPARRRPGPRHRLPGPDDLQPRLDAMADALIPSTPVREPVHAADRLPVSA